MLFRRAALGDIGGFATWNLVEDLTTSYHLHARGWKSFYYPYALSDGLAPDDIWGVMKQRGQWAFDTMRLFFFDNPLVKKGLPGRKRLNYFLIGFTYLTCGFFIPFLFLVPPWVYLTGSSVIVRPGARVRRGARDLLRRDDLRDALPRLARIRRGSSRCWSASSRSTRSTRCGRCAIRARSRSTT